MSNEIRKEIKEMANLRITNVLFSRNFYQVKGLQILPWACFFAAGTYSILIDFSVGWERLPIVLLMVVTIIKVIDIASLYSDEEALKIIEEAIEKKEKQNFDN